MALFSGRRQIQRLEKVNEDLRALMATEVIQGSTVTSPFTETDPSGRSLLPWRRNEINEAVSMATSGVVKAPTRAGYMADIPRGGASEFNQGYTQIGGATDRRTLMEQLQALYVNCPWSKACVDSVARFCSAGGMNIEPDNASKERLETVRLPSQAQKAQALFDFVNPQQNFRQMMRMIFVDLLIYGDSFIEVVWALGEPVALYPLPCVQMLVLADEHGVVGAQEMDRGFGYMQRTDTDRKAKFEPHQVIHIKSDSPRGGLYGLGPTEGAVHSITTWLFAEGLIKSLMKRGNPPNIGIAWDPDLADGEIKRFSQQYASRNLGPDNVGNPIEVKGKTEVHEFAQSKLAELDAVKGICRDEMCGEYGVSPAIVNIIESGNLGGGTGSSQFKNFRVNTCGPLEELVLEAFTFAILEQGFGVEDHRCTFDEIDWRDDETIEKIRTMRVERGGWTPNRYKDDIGEPPEEGGDQSLIILSRDVVPLHDIGAKALAAPGALPAEIGADSTPPGSPAGPKPKPTPAGTTTADHDAPAHAKGAPNESALTEAHDGAMVALFMPAVLAQELAIEGGEPPEEMHLTLAYLGDADGIDSAEDLAQVVAAWALETPVLVAQISGLGLFNPGGDDPPVTYASVDAPDLADARHRLVEALKRSGFPASMEHGFTPHVTLAYANVIDQATVPETAFRFGAVTLAVGDERTSWPLSGTAVESTAEDDGLLAIFEADIARRRAQAQRELQEV